LTLGGDPNSPWWLRGNYAPVMDEMEVFELEVLGTIPPEINGCFLRNGANPQSGESIFWLFGDGMIHSVEIANGKAISYRNKWVKTTAWEKNEWTLLSNLGNTALVHHGDKLLALYETGAPHAVNLPDLSTAGEELFGGALSGPMTAHPKVDPETGELFFIGYFPLPPYLQYSKLDAAGNLVKTEEIEIPRSVMMHDFQLTQNYVIFFDMPLVFDLSKMTDPSQFPAEFMPEHGARLGVMPREGSNADVKWFEVDPCFVFHSMNAYEDEQGRIVVDACRMESIWENGFDPNDSLPTGKPWTWTLDMSTGKVTEGLALDAQLDFPTIDFRYQGKPHRLNYGLRLVEGTPDYPMHPEGILKHDRVSGTYDVWDCGAGIQPDEALFIPDPSDTGEDAGWLISMVYNRAEDNSEVVILDAQEVAKGPIARIKMPRRVPFGFHGLWIPESQLA